MIIYSNIRAKAGGLNKKCRSFPRRMVGSAACVNCKYIHSTDDYGSPTLVRCSVDKAKPLSFEIDYLIYKLNK